MWFGNPDLTFRSDGLRERMQSNIEQKNPTSTVSKINVAENQRSLIPIKRFTHKKTL